MLDWKYNDGGRQAAGKPGEAGDCVTRAFCAFTRADYAGIWERMAWENYVDGKKSSADYGTSVAALGRVFRAAGLVPVMLERKMTIAEAYDEHGDCIMDTRDHYAAVVDGVLHDTWNCQLTKTGRESRKVRLVWKRKASGKLKRVKRPDMMKHRDDWGYVEYGA